MLVGKGMTKGYLPYRDFFDMKGPAFFLIEYLGQKICYGRWGIFLLQWINLVITLVLVCRIFALLHISIKGLQALLLLPFLYIASFTFDGGNLTEEFSLIPLFSCLYIGLRFFALRAEQIPPRKSFLWLSGGWYGISFGILLLIRVTNAALICAIILTVIISFLRDGKWMHLIICSCAFLLGLACAVLPFFLYYASKGILPELFEAVFALGFRYSSKKPFLDHIQEVIFNHRNHRLLLILIPCFLVLYLKWKTWRERLLMLIGAVFTFLAISSGNNYMHYYALTLPLIVICESALAEQLQKNESRKRTVAICLASILLLSHLPNVGTRSVIIYLHFFKQEEYTESQIALDIASRIPEEDRDSVFGYNIAPAWYTYAQLFPCIKYCGWQNNYISLMPQIYDDLKNIFQERPPKWLILPRGRGRLPDFLEKTVEEEYLLQYENEKYSLYHFA